MKALRIEAFIGAKDIDIILSQSFYQRGWTLVILDFDSGNCIRRYLTDLESKCVFENRENIGNSKVVINASYDLIAAERNDKYNRININ